MSVGLFTTNIYANWVRKEELERWVLAVKSRTYTPMLADLRGSKCYEK